MAIDAGFAMEHPPDHYIVNPLFNGRRDREISHSLLATLADFWVGHF